MKHKLNNKILEKLTDKTNRALHQTQELFNLVDGNYYKLLRLEVKLRKYNYCPSTKEEVDEIISN